MRVHFHRTRIHCPESRDSDWLGPSRLPSAHLAPTRLSMHLAWGNQRPLAYARPLLTLQSPKGAAKGAFTMTPPARSFKLCVDNHKYIQLVLLEDRDAICCGLSTFAAIANWCVVCTDVLIRMCAAFLPFCIVADHRYTIRWFCGF